VKERNNDSIEDDILTPNQVADLLKLHLKTIYKMVEGGILPGMRIGRSWRFSRQDILERLKNGSNDNKRT
jgi:excisionase family DNA binding protein